MSVTCDITVSLSQHRHNNHNKQNDVSAFLKQAERLKMLRQQLSFVRLFFCLKNRILRIHNGLSSLSDSNRCGHSFLSGCVRLQLQENHEGCERGQKTAEVANIQQNKNKMLNRVTRSGSTSLSRSPQGFWRWAEIRHRSVMSLCFLHTAPYAAKRV